MNHWNRIRLLASVFSCLLLAVMPGCNDPLSPGQTDDGDHAGTAVPQGSFEINDGAEQTDDIQVTLHMDVERCDEMRFCNDGSDWREWLAYSETHQWELQPGDGMKTVYGEFRSSSGETVQSTDTITLDTSAIVPLDGSFTINDGADVTPTVAVVLAIQVTGAAEMRFSNDGTDWCEWAHAAQTYDWELSAGDGTKTVYGEFRGPTDEVLEKSDTIVLDTTAPAASLSINAGASHTRSTAVTLSLSGSDLSEMRLKNSGEEWTDWMDYASSRSWTLSSGDGTKWVYGEFRDSAGNTTTTYDSIVLDTNAPTVNSFTINGTSGYTRSTGVTLQSSVSGYATQMRFRNYGGHWTPWVNCTHSYSWTLPSGDGTKRVYAEYRDAAGNVSTGTDTIVLDTTPPVVSSFSIDDEAYSSRDPSVLLYNSVSGATMMRFSNWQTSGWSNWEAYQSRKSWTLAGSDGWKYVYAQFRDAAGNISSSQDSILLDEYRTVRITLEKIHVINDGDGALSGSGEIYWTFRAWTKTEEWPRIEVSYRAESDHVSRDDGETIQINESALVTERRYPGNYIAFDGWVEESDSGSDDSATLHDKHYYYDDWGIGSYSEVLDDDNGLRVRAYWKIVLVD